MKERKIKINEVKLFKLMEDLNPGYVNPNNVTFEKISPEDQALFKEIFDARNNIRKWFSDYENILEMPRYWNIRGGRYWTNEKKKAIENNVNAFNQKSKDYTLVLKGFEDEDADDEGHVDVPFGFVFTFQSKEKISERV
jgi:hypothetical protein